MFELSIIILSLLSGFISAYAVAKLKKINGFLTYLSISLAGGFPAAVCITSLLLFPAWVTCVITVFFVLVTINNCHELYKKRHPET